MTILGHRVLDGAKRAAAVLVISMLGGVLGEAARCDDLKVLVTIKPIHSLVAALMEGAGAPGLLIDGAASPHAFSLKPSDSRRLAEADIVVRVSDRLETFLEKPLAGLKAPTRLVSLDRLPGLRIHALRPGGEHDGDGHGHGHGQGSKPLPSLAGAVTDNHDPHLWLDPGNARVIVASLAQVLAEARPADAARYQENAKRVDARLVSLDNDLQAELAPLAGRPFLVFHDAYQYLERRYGLTSAGAVTVNPDIPPSGRRLRALRARVAEANVACIFAEPQFPPRAIDSIIEGTGVRRGTLDPLGAALAAGPPHYAALLASLARELKACLGT